MSKHVNIYMKRDVLISLLCWGIIICFPLMFYNPSESLEALPGRFMRSLGGPLSYMLAFYINYLYLIPKYLFNGKKKQYYLINLAVIIAAVLLSTVWWRLMAQAFPFAHHRVPRFSVGIGKPHPGPPLLLIWFQAIIMQVLVIALSIAISLGQRWQRLENARRDAEKSRTEAELKNLRNQLNPHFLLNTLNNIYALISFDTEKAQAAVEQLSKLLRHVLYDNQQPFVPLYKEAAFMRNYIALMRIRVASDVDVNVNIDIAPDDATPVAPLIFISLIENAFKHGIAPSGKSYININMKEENGDITCDIRNSNYPKRANDKSGSGIGLEQVRRRLDLMYPGGLHTWQYGVTPDGKEYYSKITIYHDPKVRNS